MHGKVSTVSQMLQDGQATVFDIAYPSGDSLLHRAVTWVSFEGMQQARAMVKLLTDHEADPFQLNELNVSADDVCWSCQFDHRLSSDKPSNNGYLQPPFSNLEELISRWQLNSLQLSTLGLTSMSLRQALEHNYLAINDSFHIGLFNSMSYTALHVVVLKADLAAVTQLLTSGADPNRVADDGKSPIFLVREHQSLEIYETLVQGHASINLQDDKGHTLLHEAVDYENFALTKRLLDSGANADCQTTYGQTPLMIAIDAEEPCIAELLISHGVDVNLQDLRGIPALFYTIAYNACRTLADLKCVGHTKFDLTDQQGRGLLHYAAHFADIDMLYQLLRCRLEELCTPTMDNDGFTAAQIAQMRILGLSERDTELEAPRLLLNEYFPNSWRDMEGVVADFSGMRLAPQRVDDDSAWMEAFVELSRRLLRPRAACTPSVNLELAQLADISEYCSRNSQRVRDEEGVDLEAEQGRDVDEDIFFDLGT